MGRGGWGVSVAAGSQADLSDFPQEVDQTSTLGLKACFVRVCVCLFKYIPQVM